MKSKIVSGEAESCTPEMTAHWKQTHVTILSRYNLQDIFNTDEFGLFFQVLPNRTLELKGDKCTGGKHSKIRLTRISLASATVEKLQLLHWKKQKPEMLQECEVFIMHEKGTRKSWMDSEIFTEWIKQLESKVLDQNRKVAFIAHNCPVHPHVPDLTVTDLFFLPLNTTSVNTAYG